LLSKKEGGLIKLMQEKGHNFVLQVIVLPTSILIGNSTREVPTKFPSKFVELVSLERGTILIHPLTGMEVIQAGDILVVSGDVQAIIGSVELLGLEHIVAAAHCPPRQAAPVETTDSHEIVVENTSQEQFPVPKNTSLKNTSIITEDMLRSAKPREDTVFEVVLSGFCPCINTDLRSGQFQKHYDVSILAVRSFKGDVMQGEETMDYKLDVGDSILLLASKNFSEKWRRTYEFLTVNSFDNKILEVELHDHYFSLPSWFPVGQFVGEDRSRRVLRVPGWYNYVSIAAFIGVIIASAVGVNITIACIVAVCALCLLGVMDTKDCLHEIDWKVYIMIAFSFGIGTAVDTSGLAAVISYYIAKTNLQGFELLFVVSCMTSFLANIVTNKAAAQVMFPIVFRTLQTQGRSPLAAVMVLAHTSALACFTPFGHSANVVVTGPGGYTARDWLAFGLPINIAIMILCPFLASIIYDFW